MAAKLIFLICFILLPLAKATGWDHPFLGEVGWSGPASISSMDLMGSKTVIAAPFLENSDIKILSFPELKELDNIGCRSDTIQTCRIDVLKVSPDFKYLAVAGDWKRGSTTVKGIAVFQIAEKHMLTLFETIEQPTAIAWSANQQFVVGYKNGNLEFFDHELKQRAAWKAHGSGISSLIISRNREIFCRSERNGLSVWNLDTHDWLRTLDEESELTFSDLRHSSFAFLANEGQLATTSRDGIEIWDILQNKKVRTIGNKQSMLSVFGVNAEESKILIASSPNNSLQYFDLRTMKFIHDFRGYAQFGWGIRSIFFSPDGNVAMSEDLTSIDGSASATSWDLNKAGEDKIHWSSTKSRTQENFKKIFYIDNANLFTAGSFWNNGSVEKWNTDTGQLLLQKDADDYDTHDLKLSFNDRRALSVLRKSINEISFVDLSLNKVFEVPEGHRFEGLEVLQGNSILTISNVSPRGTATIVDLDRLTKVEYPLPCFPAPYTSSLDGSKIFGTCYSSESKENSLVQIDVKSGKVLSQFAVPSANILRSPNGKYFALNGAHSVSLFSTTDGKLIRELGNFRLGVSTFVFTEDSEYLIVSGFHLGNIEVISLSDGRSIRQILGPSGVVSMDVSPDRSQLAAANGTGEIYIWDLQL
jgi:WD40 repeat protein